MYHSILSTLPMGYILKATASSAVKAAAMTSVGTLVGSLGEAVLKRRVH